MGITTGQSSRVPWLIGAMACAWFVFISGLHWGLSREQVGTQILRMGYMPVVTNLACPIIDEASQQFGSDLRFVGVKFNSFAEMGEALRGGHIEAAFMIAPLAVVLFQQGADVEVVYIGNRHESTLVVKNSLDVRDFGELAGRTLAVPMRYSGHYLVARQLQERFGQRGRSVNVVEMNPPDMPAALASGALDAYFVGEPFAFASIRGGAARTLYRVEDLWPGFICNLVVVRGDLIRERPGDVQRLVTSSIRSGVWASTNSAEAASIAAKHWNQNPGLVAEAFESYADRFVWDRYEPRADELQQLADEMVRFGLLESALIDGLANPVFARDADMSNLSDLASVVGFGAFNE